MKSLLISVLASLCCAVQAFAGQTPDWENQGAYYFLRKDVPGNFPADSAAKKKYGAKYTVYDGMRFLIQDDNNKNNLGRLDLSGNKLFVFPLSRETRLNEIHLLLNGNHGNQYLNDPVLGKFGDRYFYAVVTLIFEYEDDSDAAVSVPVFWDWFPVKGGWKGDGAAITFVDMNKGQVDAALFHATFANPAPDKNVRKLVLTDSWIGDYPFSEILAVTLKGRLGDGFIPCATKTFDHAVIPADKKTADSRLLWAFDQDYEGWVPGNSNNWSDEAQWRREEYAKTGVIAIPACGWGGDKATWIENKITLPQTRSVKLSFLLHSGSWSDYQQSWTDGRLKVTVKGISGEQTVFDQIFCNDWKEHLVDLSAFAGQTVLLRFEAHGDGTVRLRPSDAPACNGETALIDYIRITE